MAAAALRSDSSNLVLRSAGWLLAGVAAWVAVGLAGGWAPLWPALPVVVLGIVGRSGRNLALWVGVDVLLVIGLGLLSIPVLTPTRMAMAALALATVGLASDLAIGGFPDLVRRVARWGAVPVVIGILGLIGLSLRPAASDDAPLDPDWAMSLSSGIAPMAMPGERRITLETGAVGWFDAPRGPGPHTGALFFHGADSRGAHHPTALIVRRALVHAGFAVLAVDHPGYGSSPHPALDAEMTAWDPQPTDLAAYRALRAMPGVDGVVAVGHSMGNLDVVNLLRAEVPLAAAVMLGAAFHKPGMEDYWDARFFSDRNIAPPPKAFPVRKLQRRYFDVRRLAEELPADHPPVEFVTFGVEWPDVRSTRDVFYNLLPGPKDVEALVDTTHYLSTMEWRALIIGDTEATRDLADVVDELAQEPSDGS